ncbi:hypothetical protein GIB67_016117 [Kingdonia uniflora]|uniref:Secoisolariciresinol dehydrogenase n=1 Tax=Kingdonia uniflora TaxID=39325 RepID=A0A7J7L204_9MAGN|nr:hypothetical protein GIB67_016117 [Kingdonia uniflora]
MSKFAKVTLNYLPRGENKYADSLAYLVGVLGTEARYLQIEIISTPSIDRISVCTINTGGDKRGDDDWRKPFLAYLGIDNSCNGPLPKDPKEHRQLINNSKRYTNQNGRLYRLSVTGPYLKCLSKSKAKEMLRELHERTCGGSHAAGRSLANRAITQGVFLPDMRKQAEEYSRRCDTCQRHGHMIRTPALELHASKKTFCLHEVGMHLSLQLFMRLIISQLSRSFIEGGRRRDSDKNKMRSNGLLPPVAGERRLEGKVALITGAAQGIGEATAILYTQHGAKVVIADIQDYKGYAVCKKIGLNNASFIHCDVSIEEDVKNAVDHAVAKFGKLDIMFNNAAIEGSTCPSVTDTKVSEFEKTLSVNCTGVFLGIKHAARVLIPRKQGLMKNTAAELGRFGIRVNCISSFMIATSMATDYFSDKDGKWIEDLACKIANLKGVVLTVDDVAKAAVYFGSDDAKYVSGHNFMIDGGLTTTNDVFGIFNNLLPSRL